MLYLAEVQKQRGGLLSGNSKTELKLLACQRSDQNWSTVSEDIVAAEEASKLSDGALVLVELSTNRQVQRIQEAGRPLVNILQNFSRQLEKFKLKEDEIEQWKQTLTFQAQEFNRREMEMETRLEQLQELENDLQQLESQKQEVAASREEIDKLQAEIERNRAELSGAWEHLRGEQRRLEECQTPTPGSVLDEERSRTLSDLFNRLSNCSVPIDSLREKYDLALLSLEKQQAILNPHWQQFQTQRTIADHQMEEVERLSQACHQHQAEFQQLENSLEQQRSRLLSTTALLESKQVIISTLKEHLRNQEDLYQLIHSLATNADNVIIGQTVDLEALQQMALDELQKTVQDLQEKLEKDSSFVQEQEQELKYKQETIQGLQSKIQQLSGQDHKNAAEELTDEQDLYQMLNESLVGQRRSLLERGKTLKQYQNVLLQRQGHSVNISVENPLNLGLLLSQVETQRQQQSQEVQRLEREIEQMRAGLEIDQGMIGNQNHDLAQKQQELKAMEENLLNLRLTNAEFRGRLHLYEEALQQIQDGLDGLRHIVAEMGESLTKFQAGGDDQQQAIGQMRQTIQNLISQPELLIS